MRQTGTERCPRCPSSDPDTRQRKSRERRDSRPVSLLPFSVPEGKRNYHEARRRTQARRSDVDDAAANGNPPAQCKEDEITMISTSKT